MISAMHTNGSSADPFAIFPAFETVKARAANADLLALTVPLCFDHETAVSLADRFVDQPYFALLESASSGPKSRHSFMAFDPLWVFKYHSPTSRVTILKGDGLKEHSERKDSDPIRALRHQIGGKKLESIYPEGVRLGGPDVAAWAGVVGYFGYDIAHNLEPTIGSMPPKTLGLPDSWFFMPQSFLVFDHLSRRLFVSRIFETQRKTLGSPEKQGDLERTYQKAKDELVHLLRKLQAFHGPPSLVIKEDPVDFSRFHSAITEEDFYHKVSRCLEAIRAGDIFQIQIGNRLSQKTHARPFDIFRHLRMLNPSPYMFFCRFLQHHLIGASPEMMVQVEGSKVTHRPIAGTRRRFWNDERDLAAKLELHESEKERAEHIMLVDLSRNDIGRIAAPGTVLVEELMKIEEYSHVFHLVSQVSGQLGRAEDGTAVDGFDALAVSFPNGTVTGAPKIKAMEMINQLETLSREFYAGCLGLISFNGEMRTTLLIRTIHYADQVASTQASAGIVYDSTPEHEWKETRNKMSACLLAIQNTL